MNDADKNSSTHSTRWYFADWMSDPGVRASSLAARGLWMDMLCLAAANKESAYGYVLINGKPPTPKALAKLCQTTVKEVGRLLAELAANGVFSRTKGGVIYCRRMVLAAKNRRNGRLGGNPNLLKTKETLNPVIHPLEIEKEIELELETLNSSSKEKESKKTPKKRKESMSENWRPDDHGLLWARTVCHFDEGKIEQLVVACRDYHLKHGTLIAGEVGLAATWRTWCNNEIKFATEKRNGPGRPRALQDDSLSISRAAERLAEKARHGDFSFGARPTGRPAESKTDLRLLPKG